MTNINAPSKAFDISLDDISTVLMAYELNASEDFIMLCYNSLDKLKIEQEALFGTDLDEQTNYALDEITRQLKQNGLISGNEPWEMTKSEFIKQSKEFYDKHGNDNWLLSRFHVDVNSEVADFCFDNQISFAEQYHLQHIVNAINNGIDIPDKVLGDYPDLDELIVKDGPKL